MITFTVYGIAQPKGSMRAYVPRGMKFPIVTDSNRNAKSWAQLVAQGASNALAAIPGAAILDGPVRLSVLFYLPRPKKYQIRKWTAQTPAHLTAPDLDKLIRSIGDALTGVVYRDDAQVVDLLTSKRYTDPQTPPHVIVRVEALAAVRPLDVPPAHLPLFELEGVRIYG